jgi:two-component system, NarL family, nitrate/nitrite response regulator NarL
VTLNAIRGCLRKRDDTKLVGTYCTAAEASFAVSKRHPDLILIDQRVRGGIETAIRYVSKACPTARIIIVSASEHDRDVIEAFEAGAHGYVLKGSIKTDLAGLIDSVRAGDCYVTPRLGACLLIRSGARALKDEYEKTIALGFDGSAAARPSTTVRRVLN